MHYKVISFGTTHQFSDNAAFDMEKMARLDTLLSNNTTMYIVDEGRKKRISAQAEENDERGKKKIKKRRLNNISR